VPACRVEVNHAAVPLLQVDRSPGVAARRYDFKFWPPSCYKMVTIVQLVVLVVALTERAGGVAVVVMATVAEMAEEEAAAVVAAAALG
jgi:hypothetical protein